MDEEERERLQQLRQLYNDLPYYSGKKNAAEANMKKLKSDFEKYTVAKEQLPKVKKTIMDGKNDVITGRYTLGNYASGNKYNEATGVISKVEGLFFDTAAGIETILMIVKKDIELLNQEHIEEYFKYSNAIESYNTIAGRIRSLGGSCSDVEKTITKASLL